MKYSNTINNGMLHIEAYTNLFHTKKANMGSKAKNAAGLAEKPEEQKKE